MLDLHVLREELRVGVDDYRKVERLRDAVVALFEQQTGRTWSRQAGKVETRIRCGEGQTVLYLDVAPVETIDEIVERDYGQPDWGEPLDASAYFLDPACARVEKLATQWKKHIRITYTGGIDTTGTNTPADIREALIVQAKFMHERLTSEKIAVRGTSSKDGAATYLENSALHPLFRAVAGRHVAR